MADVVAWVLSLDTLDDKESVAERIRQEGVDGASLPLFAQSADFRLLKQDLQNYRPVLDKDHPHQ